MNATARDRPAAHDPCPNCGDEIPQPVMPVRLGWPGQSLRCPSRGFEDSTPATQGRLTFCAGPLRSGIPNNDALARFPTACEAPDVAPRRAESQPGKTRHAAQAGLPRFPNALPIKGLRLFQSGSSHCARCADRPLSLPKNVARRDGRTEGWKDGGWKDGRPEGSSVRRFFVGLQCNGQERSQIPGDPNAKAVRELGPARGGG